MVKPNSPKEVQPQQNKIDNNTIKNVITINLIATCVLCTLVFFAMIATTQKLSNKIDMISSNNQNEVPTEEVARGLIVDMGEFTMNLSDPNARRYLKVNVTLELSKTANEINSEKTDIALSQGLEYEMNQYKPAIKDSIISILSSKTTSELATIPGKETAKEQIAEAVEAIFNGEREVIRVSFGQFIMQ